MSCCSPNVLLYTQWLCPENSWAWIYDTQLLTRGLFLERPEKPFVRLRPAYSVNLVFSYVVKGWKIKITVRFRDSRGLRFEDTKRSMSHEKFRDFRETGSSSCQTATPSRLQNGGLFGYKSVWLSFAFANIFMAVVETEILKLSALKPLVWK